MERPLVKYGATADCRADLANYGRESVRSRLSRDLGREFTEDEVEWETADLMPMVIDDEGTVWPPIGEHWVQVLGTVRVVE